MGCGCGGSKTRTYEVTTSAGAKKTVDSLSAAMTLVRAEGGHYVIKK
jgi:hypothetical protein